MNNLAKRIFFGSVLWGIFGFLCFAAFSSNPDVSKEMLKYQVWAWDNYMMWSTVMNRYALGFFVAIMWFIRIHPCFKFRIPVFFRWMVPWFLISLPMAIWILMWNYFEAAKQAFRYVLIAWMIIGSIIDMIITKIAWDGEDLKLHLKK